MSDEKKLYIIAGCNGAGKTTASKIFLPDGIFFLNADIIAYQLKPDNVEEVAILAGRIMLNHIDELFSVGASFAIETTLSSKIYIQKIKIAQLLGYHIHLIYFWLNNVDLAILRVKYRVAQGGHNIENQVIRRRYYRGLNNLINIYLPLIDEIMIFDNSGKQLELIAERYRGNLFFILNQDKWNLIKSSL
jgi:predicted ABC-type ATPase